MVMQRDEAVALVGRVYEAAAVPELWPDVLGAIAHSIDAAGACLFTPGGVSARWISSPDMNSALDEFVAGGWLEHDGFNDRLLASGRTGFVGDLELFAPADLLVEPVYADWLYPRGFGWGAATIMRLPHDRTVFLNVERRRDRGPVEVAYMAHLNQLHPHLSRAAMISSHLAWERAHAAGSALQIIGTPAAFVRPRGRLESANALFQALVPHPVRGVDPHIILADPRAQEKLVASLARIEAGSPFGQSIPVPSKDGGGCVCDARSSRTGRGARCLQRMRGHAGGNACRRRTRSAGGGPGRTLRSDPCGSAGSAPDRGRGDCGGNRHGTGCFAGDRADSAEGCAE